MKYLTLFIFTTLQIACSNDSNKESGTIYSNEDLEFIVLEDSCTIKFNKIFNQFTFDSIYYQFDSVYFLNPFLITDFYSEADIEAFTFLKFLNVESELNVAIADFNDDLDYHKMYFCIEHRGVSYIDEGTYINCNVSFLNNYGIKVSERTSQDSVLFRVNLRDSRMESEWKVDSCFGIQRFNKVLIAEKYLIIDDTLNIPYNQKNNDLLMFDTSSFKFQRIALSSTKLILEDVSKTGNGTYYYMVKN